MPRRFLKWYQQSKYRRCHVQVQVNWSHWLGTVLYCLRLPEARSFTSESISTLRRSADPLYCYIFKWSIGLGNTNLVSVLVGVDRNQILWLSLTDLKFLCSEIPKKNIFNIWDKNKFSWQFNIEHNKNNIIIINQCTIA